MAAAIKLKMPPKAIKVNEDRPMSPVYLSRYIDSLEEEKVAFSLKSESDPLPQGVVLNESGQLSGKPVKGSARPHSYHLKIIGQGKEDRIEFELPFHVYKIKTADEITSLFSEAWEQLTKEGIMPETLEEIIQRPISKTDMYYLLQRFASFTVWNADDLRLADNGQLVTVKEASDEFNVYDFEVCLVATPKDLFSHERTLGDALQTAKAMVKETYRRKWHVEFGGFDRMANIAWYEIKKLNAKGAHQMEIRNYQPPELKGTLQAAQNVNKEV